MKTDSVIVVPIHNALPYLERLTTQLEQYPDHQKVFVDDASEPNVKEYLDKWIHDRAWSTTVNYLRNEKQQLFSRTANKGIRSAYKFCAPQPSVNPNPPRYYQEWVTNSHWCKYIVVVNTDCDLKKGWLEALESLMNDFPEVGIAAYRDSTAPDMVHRCEDVTGSGYVTGHCIMFRVKMLEQIGVYNETDTGGPGCTFSELSHLKGLAHIGSDREISYRARAAGWKTVYSNFPGVEHEAGKSWNHNLLWLSQFQLEPLWEASNTL